MAALKRLYGLREMAINVPDRDVPALRRVVNAAIQTGHLPPEATGWVPRAAKGTPSPDAAKAKGKDAEKPTAPVSADTKAALDKSQSAWDGLANAGDATKAKSSDPHAGVPEMDPRNLRAEPPPIPKAAMKRAKRPLAPDLPRPKSARVKLGKGSTKPRDIDWAKDASYSGEFPDLPAPGSANADVSGEDDYKSPFGHLGLGGSSWDSAPDWMRDPEKMPHASGGSMRTPRSPEDAPKSTGPSPVGRQWTDKDVAKMSKKPGMLAKLFGRKSK